MNDQMQIALITAASTLFGVALAAALQFLTQRQTQNFQAREARLNELVDRLQHDRQFVRASAVVGIADLMTSSSGRRRMTDAIFKRGLSQLSVMLHTEEDGAVQRTLRPRFKELAKKVQGNGDASKLLIEALVDACDCSYRWLVTAAAYGTASCGQNKMIDARQILSKRAEHFFELKSSVIDYAFEESNRIGQKEWEEFVFENDAGKRDNAHPGRFLGSAFARYSLCVRTLRDVKEELRGGLDACECKYSDRANAHLANVLTTSKPPREEASGLKVNLE